jgi:hypothetical protein
MKAPLVVCLSLFFGFVLQAGDNQNFDNKRHAVSFLRLVNTAQQEHFQKKGTFLEWEQLRNSAEFESVQLRFADQFGLGGMKGTQSPAPVAGYSIQSALGSEGKHYAITLSDRNAPDSCSIGYLSDESGLIRETRPIGCK